MDMADEYLEKCVRAMGRELGDQYYQLWCETSWAYMKWRQYESLYGTDQARFDLLMQTAQHLFAMIDQVMWGDLLLHVTRLTGAQKTSGQVNLTIKNLPTLIADGPLSVKVQALVDVACDAASFAVQPRHKLLAHVDLQQALGRGKIRTLGSRTQMRGALDAIGAVLNAVAVHHSDTQTSFQHCHGFGEAEDLLAVIEAGHAARNLQLKWAAP